MTGSLQPDPPQTQRSFADRRTSLAEPVTSDSSSQNTGWRGRLARWLLSATLAGLLISLVVHAVFLVLAALIFMHPPAGSGGASPAPVEFAVVSDAELTALQEQTPQPDPFNTEALEMEDSFDAVEFDAPVADASFAAESAGDVSPLGGAAGNVGEGFELAGGAGGAASFFGVEARGSRFVYIVDVSGSMEGVKIATMRSELIESISSLLEHTSFMVYFYSTQTKSLGGRGGRWFRASERNKKLAGREIRVISAFGETNPVPAFEQAFAMRPKPDAIYFMTDGIFPPRVAQIVSELNAKSGSRTPIHTISFVNREARKLLRLIADQSGGTYTHVVDPNL